MTTISDLGQAQETWGIKLTPNKWSKDKIKESKTTDFINHTESHKFHLESSLITINILNNNKSKMRYISYECHSFDFFIQRASLNGQLHLYMYLIMFIMLVFTIHVQTQRKLTDIFFLSPYSSLKNMCHCFFISIK